MLIFELGRNLIFEILVLLKFVRFNGSFCWFHELEDLRNN